MFTTLYMMGTFIKNIFFICSFTIIDKDVIYYCCATYLSKRYFILSMIFSSITHFIMDIHSYFTENPDVSI